MHNSLPSPHYTRTLLLTPTALLLPPASSPPAGTSIPALSWAMPAELAALLWLRLHHGSLCVPACQAGERVCKYKPGVA